MAPAEVEDVLLRHPAIAQAVVFALPHPRLGEEVGAAVVVVPGAIVSEKTSARTSRKPSQISNSRERSSS